MDIQEAASYFEQQLVADGRAAGTVAQRLRHVRAFTTWAGDQRLERDAAAVTPQVIASYLGSLSANGCAPARRTANSVRSSLRQFFGYLEALGVVERSPARVLRNAPVPSSPRQCPRFRNPRKSGSPSGPGLRTQRSPPTLNENPPVTYGHGDSRKRSRCMESEDPSLERARAIVLSGGDHADALPHVMEAVSRGHAEAIYALGTWLRDGLGLERDEALARARLKEAADLGSIEACNDYAHMLEEGIGGEVNVQEAFAYIQTAAEGGSATSCYILAQMLIEGDVAAPDPALWFQWMARAAELGHAEGQYEIGRALELGRKAWSGKPPGADHWYRLAAGQGNDAAARALAARSSESPIED